MYQLIDNKVIKSKLNNPISFSVESETLDLRRQWLNIILATHASMLTSDISN